MLSAVCLQVLLFWQACTYSAIRPKLSVISLGLLDLLFSIYGWLCTLPDLLVWLDYPLEKAHLGFIVLNPVDLGSDIPMLDAKLDISL